MPLKFFACSIGKLIFALDFYRQTGYFFLILTHLELSMYGKFFGNSSKEVNEHSRLSIRWPDNNSVVSFDSNNLYKITDKNKFKDLPLSTQYLTIAILVVHVVSVFLQQLYHDITETDFYILFSSLQYQVYNALQCHPTLTLRLQFVRNVSNRAPWEIAKDRSDKYAIELLRLNKIYKNSRENLISTQAIIQSYSVLCALITKSNLWSNRVDSE